MECLFSTTHPASLSSKSHRMFCRYLVCISFVQGLTTSPFSVQRVGLFAHSVPVYCAHSPRPPPWPAHSSGPDC